MKYECTEASTEWLKVGISWVIVDLFASQEGICSVELVVIMANTLSTYLVVPKCEHHWSSRFHEWLM